MHARSLLVLLVACFGARVAAAQRLPALKPGTMLQITTRDGGRVEGPLAEVRDDTIHLATTLERPERAIPLRQVRRLAYADGTDSHGQKGALIGAGIGLAIAVLAGRGEDADFRVFSTQEGRTIMTLLGGGIGAAMGAASDTPHWVVAYGDMTQRRSLAPRGPVLVVARMRF